jgi:hypothetical protein
MPDPVVVEDQVADALARNWRMRGLPVFGVPLILPEPTRTDLVAWLIDLANRVAQTSVILLPSDPPIPPASTEP